MPFELPPFSLWTAVNFLIITLGSIYSIILHEIAHGLTAYWFGDSTARDYGRLSLSPIPHIDPIGTLALPLGAFVLNTIFGSAIPIFGWAKPVPVMPSNFRHYRAGSIVVALAGVTVNFLIAVLIFLGLSLAGTDRMSVYRAIMDPKFMDQSIVYGLIQLAFTNIMLMSFNLIPLPPLDGFKFLVMVVPQRISSFLQKNESTLTILFVIMIFTPLSGFILSPIYNFFAGLFLTVFHFRS